MILDGSLFLCRRLRIPPRADLAALNRDASYESRGELRTLVLEDDACSRGHDEMELIEVRLTFRITSSLT